MKQAVRAPVKPRFVSLETGATLPLEDEVRRLLEEAGPKLIRIDGPPGSGKTTALSHLAAVLPNATRLRLFDNDDDIQQTKWTWKDDVVLFAAACAQSVELPQTMPRTLSLKLARWERDDLIEYLLARHPAQCAAVMSRIAGDAEREFAGVPEIWTAALDELAGDPALTDAQIAIVHRLRAHTPTEELWEQLGSFSLKWEMAGDIDAAEMRTLLSSKQLGADLFRLLRHAPVRRLIAAERLASDLNDPQRRCQLPPQMSRELVQAVARRVESSETVRSKLRTAMQTPSQQSMAVSLLCTLNPAARPSASWSLLGFQRPFLLNGAYLSGVSWSRIDLSHAKLVSADLCGADLRNAKLQGALAPRANLSGARLAGAALEEFDASDADLSGADLSSVRAGLGRFFRANFSGANLDGALLKKAAFIGADLRAATLRRANLKQAMLQHALIAEADFSGADLTEARMEYLDLRQTRLDGARLHNTYLMHANLEGMRLDGIDLRGARLQEALLTGSSMIRGNLTKCSLRGAGLADVSWEGVMLRDADLRDVSFHLGSSRSGLVGSPYVSEGTRTGFYTDDYEDQDFKSPEEIRKADLRDADLRGALLNNTDFYLVDLRGARFDLDQEQHFRRCGAILQDRCPRDR